jgi:hypothetical protein
MSFVRKPYDTLNIISVSVFKKKNQIANVIMKYLDAGPKSG